MRGTTTVRRAATLLAVGLATAGLASCELLDDTNTVVVDTVVDGADADPGDGTCEMTVGVGDCSLRAAIDEANANVLIVAVTVPSDTYVLDDSGPAEDANASGDLDIAPASGHLSVLALGRGAVVDAAGADGGIDARSGVLVTWGLSVTGSSGAGHVARSGATASVLVASPHGNAGPGVRFDAGSTGQFLSSTSSGNGAGIANDGDVSVRFSTITANDGPGIEGTGTTTVATSIVANQSGGPDCVGTVTSNGWNAVGEAGCGVGPTDTLTTDLALTPTTLDGVPAFVPGARSFDVRNAVPVGSGGCGGSVADQATTARPVGSACDKGALETEAPAIDLVVDSALDVPDADVTDGVCDDGSGGCTLRAAVDEANAQGGASAANYDPVTITIADGIDPVMTSYDRLVIAGGVTIEGGGAVVDFQFHDDSAIQVLHQRLQLHDLTLASTGSTGAAVIDADVAGASGASIDLEQVSLLDIGSAGVRVAGGDLTMVDVLFATKNSSDTAIVGTVESMLLDRVTVAGADRVVEVVAAGDIDIVDSELAGGYDSTLIGDHVSIEGTTISGSWGYVLSGDVTIDRSTYAQNAGSLGLVNATAAIASSTLVNNSIFSSGFDFDLFVDDAATVTVSGSLIGGPDHDACRVAGSGTIVSGGYNVVSDTTCGLAATGDVVASPLLIGPLQDNGGATPTVLPLAASAAIDAVRVGTSGVCEVGELDQRGVARPQGRACDAGAVEVEVVSLVFVVDTAADAPDADPADGICDDGTGACTLRAAVTEANVQGGATASSYVPVTISIAPGVNPVLSLPPADPASEFDSDPMVISGGVTIEGNGATIDLNHRERHLQVLHQYLDLRDLTFAAPDFPGEAIVSSAVFGASGPSVTLENVVMELADGSEGVNMAGGDLTVTDSDLGAGRDEAVVGSFGSVLVEGSAVAGFLVTAHDVVVRDSLLIGSEYFGGITVDDTGHTLIERTTIRGMNGFFLAGPFTLRSSSFIDNREKLAVFGTGTIELSTFGGNSYIQPELAGDLSVFDGDVTVRGSIFAAYPGSELTPYPSCTTAAGATISSEGFNVGADTSCGLTATGDVQGVDPQLGAVGDNGGTAPTRRPAATSPAIDRIPVGTAGLCDGSLSPDQRSVARPQGSGCDSGSVERSGLDPA